MTSPLIRLRALGPLLQPLLLEPPWQHRRIEETLMEQQQAQVQVQQRVQEQVQQRAQVQVREQVRVCPKTTLPSPSSCSTWIHWKDPCVQSSRQEVLPPLLPQQQQVLV